MPSTPTLAPQAVTLNRRGVDLTEAGKYNEALAAFTRALELAPGSPGSPGILFNRAEAWRQTGDFAAATADLQAALAAEPGSADTMHALGLIAYDADDYDGAVAWYEKSLAVNPRNGQAWNDLGVVRFRRGDYASARTCFEKAVHADHDSTDAWFNLADTYEELGLAHERARALVSLEEARLRAGDAAREDD